MRATRSNRLRPRWTLRLRLTMLYGAVFLAAGAALLGITYALVAGSIPTGKFSVVTPRDRAAQQSLPPLPPGGATFQTQVSSGRASVIVRAYKGTIQKLDARNVAVLKRASAQLNHQRSAELQSLETKSGIALVLMAFVSIGLGWLMAGRALRPLRTMGARARGITERNLHERLALEGPDDELKELGDTFDSLLARLEKAFDSQRRFVAHASHELRTPITLERTLVEVALSDPEPSTDALQDTCRRVLSAVEQQERLIEALLTLARSQRGLADRREVNLHELTGQVVSGIDHDSIRIQPELSAAMTTGDPRLLERLVANLVENALKYNQEHGWVRVSTSIRGRQPTLEVVNTGPVVEPDLVGELVQPFRRLNGKCDGAGQARGLGLGLSIVAAIAEAHDATLAVVARPEGGLDVAVGFPPCPERSLH